MPITAAKLLVIVDAETGKAVQGLEVVQKTVDKTAKTGAKAMADFGASMSKIGGKLSTFVTVPLLGAAALSVRAASDLSESANKMNVVFGGSAGIISDFAKTAAANLGMSSQAAIEAAGTFGNLFTSMGMGQQPAAEMSKGLVQLASDLASFNNLDPSLVLEKLRSGLVGEVEPLRTLGINLSAAAVQAEAFRLGLAKTTEELTPAILTQARYSLILKQSTNAQGDFARTSDGMANQMRIVKAEAIDAAAKFGQVLLPAVTDVLQIFTGLLEKLLEMPEGQQKAVTAIAGIAIVAGPAMKVVGGLATALAGLGAAGWVALGPLGLVAAGIAAIGGAVYLASQNAEASTARALAAANKIHDTAAIKDWGKLPQMRGNTQLDAMFKPAAQAASDYAKAITSANDPTALFIQQLPRQQGELAGLIEAYNQAKQAALDFAEAQGEARLQAGLSGELTGALKSYRETMAQLSKETVGAPASKFADLQKAANGAAEALQSVIAKMIYQQAVSGLSAEAATSLARALGLISEQDYAVATAVQNLKAAFDPTTTAGAAGLASAMSTLNTAIANLAASGAPLTLESITQAYNDLATAANAASGAQPKFEMGLFAGMTPADLTKGQGFLADMKAQANAALSEIKAAAATTSQTALMEFTGADWAGTGRNLVEGIAQGVRNGSGMLAEAMKKVVQDALAAARAAGEIQSPSKLFARAVGEPISAGIATGIINRGMLPAYATAGVVQGAAQYAQTVNVNATLANGLDMNDLANEIARRLRSM